MKKKLLRKLFEVVLGGAFEERVDAEAYSQESDDTQDNVERGRRNRAAHRAAAASLQ